MDKKSAEFFRMIAVEADQFPVELIDITGKKSVQGVAIIDGCLSAARKTELRQLIASLSASSKIPSIALLDKQTGLPGKAGFVSQADAEIVRVRKSRLPCSLLLIKVLEKKGNNDLKTASSIIKKESNDYLARFDRNVLALLLPGMNKNRAVKKAHTIHKALANELLSSSVSIGLAICLARNIITTDNFINIAQEQLQRATKEGAGVYHAARDIAEDSCQVTPEERAHLFSIL